MLYTLNMLNGYKYRIYPKPKQAELLEKHFGCARYIYNWALDTKNIMYSKTGKSPTAYTLANELPRLKKELAWLGEVNSQALQKSLLNLDTAFTNFFRKVKAGNQNPGYPQFKKKRGRQSFQCPQHVLVDFDGKRISLPKIPKIKTVFSRRFKGEIKTTTISKNPSGKYFVTILVEDGKTIPKKKNIIKDKAIGVDLGLKDFIVTSSGEKVKAPKFRKSEQLKIALLDRRMRKKVKGSKNRNKARIKLARAYERTENRRKDFLHKLSSGLIEENQTICLEDLNVQGMVKNHCLAGSISDAAWSEFVSMLEYKAEWNGNNLIFIGRFDPSSKMCSNCGKTKNDLTLDVRSWKCEVCGIVHDRDINAAINIKNFALMRQNLIKQIPLDERKLTLEELKPLLKETTFKQASTLNQESTGIYSQ